MNISQLIQIKQINSTNDYIRYYSLDTLLIADEQLAGRGCYDRQWVSPKDNLYLSYKFQIKENLYYKQSFISIIVSIALHQVLLKYSSVPLLIKWPNDILNNKYKKLAGILLERNLKNNFYIIGIGINLKPIENYQEYGYLESKNSIFKASLAIEIIERFIELIENISEQKLKLLINYWQEYNYLQLNTQIQYINKENQKQKGIYRGLDYNGGLKIENLQSKKIKSYLGIKVNYRAD